jgi:uncharacterized protein (TIRG00374 family)
VAKAARLLVSGTLLGWLAWRMDWGHLRHAFAHLRLECWAVGLILYLLSQLVSAYRWQLLARPLGFHRPLRHYLGFYFIGMYFNLFFPTSVGGDVVRAWYLDNRSGRRLTSLLSVLVDRLSGLLVLLTLGCVAVCLSPFELPAWIWVSAWSLFLCAGAGLAGLPLVARFLVGWEEQVIGRWSHKWVSRLRALCWSLAESVLLYGRKPRLLLVTTALSLVVQSLNVVLVWMVGLALDAPVPASYYWVLVPMVTLLTLVPISLNGMGVREGGTVLFLAPLGISQGLAVMLAFLWFAAMSAAAVVGGLVYLFGQFPRPEMESQHESVRDHSGQGREGQLKAAA